MLALDDSPANATKQIAALRILARALGLAGDNQVKPETPAILRIEGDITQNLARMGLTQSVLREAGKNAGSFSPNELEGEEDEDAAQEGS